MRTLALGECSVTVGPSWIVTRFADGVELHAHPNRSREDVARARALGYGGDDEAVVAQMTCDHDLLHTALAVARGLPCSPTLYGVAHGEPVEAEVARREEEEVFAVTRALNLLGATLVR